MSCDPGGPELPRPISPAAALGPESSEHILSEGGALSLGISQIEEPPLKAPLPLGSLEQSPREGRRGHGTGAENI